MERIRQALEQAEIDRQKAGVSESPPSQKQKKLQQQTNLLGLRNQLCGARQAPVH